MAFRNEVRDFMEAFQVGAKIKDTYKRRKLDEQEAKDKVSIAQNKLDYDTSKFNKVYDQNERKIKSADDRYKSDYGLRQQAGDRAERDLKFRTDNATATQTRLAAADAERAKVARYKQDPFAQMNDEKAAQSALPTGVNPNIAGVDMSGADTSQPAQGIPAEGPGEKEGGAEDAGEAQPEVGISAAVPRSASVPGVAAALHGGLKYLQQHFKLDAGLPGQGSAGKDGARRLFEGEGSNTQAEMDGINQKLDELSRKNGVDPKTLTESERQIRNLTELYNWHLKRRQPEEANAAAASILQYSRGVASMLGMQAIKKLQGGDVAGAAQAVIQAHDQIPDGRSVQLDPESMTFKVIEEDSGKLLQEGKVTPEMIFSVANGFKDGSGFFKVIMDAASRDKSMQDKERAPTSAEVKSEELKPQPGYEAPVPAENAPVPDVSSAIHKELTNMRMTDNTPVFENEQKMVESVGPEAMTAISELGELIAKYNEVPPDKAGRLALLLVNPADKGGNSQFDFQMIDDRNPNVLELMAKDGTRLKLPARIVTPLILQGHKAMTAVGQKVMERQKMESGRRIEGSARRTKTEMTNQDNERRAGIDVADSGSRYGGHVRSRPADNRKEKVSISETIGAAGRGIEAGIKSIAGVRPKRTAEEARNILKKKKSKTRVAGGPR